MQKPHPEAGFARIDDSPRLALAGIRSDVIGIDTPVPLLDGTERPYVFLDNAASTPTFGTVLRCIEEFLPWYSGVHRGTGFKSLLATEVFDAAHDVVGAFVGADPEHNTVIFTKNTTECVNKLANRLVAAARRHRDHDRDGTPFQRPSLAQTLPRCPHRRDGRRESGSPVPPIGAAGIRTDACAWWR